MIHETFDAGLSLTGFAYDSDTFRTISAEQLGDKDLSALFLILNLGGEL